MDTQLILTLVGYGICLVVIYDQHRKLRDLKLILAALVEIVATQEGEADDNETRTE